jgi:hypothetical protein
MPTHQPVFNFDGLVRPDLTGRQDLQVVGVGDVGCAAAESYGRGGRGVGGPTWIGLSWARVRRRYAA